MYCRHHVLWASRPPRDKPKPPNQIPPRTAPAVQEPRSFAATDNPTGPDGEIIAPVRRETETTWNKSRDMDCISTARCTWNADCVRCVQCGVMKCAKGKTCQQTPEGFSEVLQRPSGRRVGERFETFQVLKTVPKFFWQILDDFKGHDLNRCRLKGPPKDMIQPKDGTLDRGQRSILGLDHVLRRTFGCESML